MQRNAKLIGFQSNAISKLFGSQLNHHCQLCYIRLAILPDLVGPQGLYAHHLVTDSEIDGSWNSTKIWGVGVGGGIG